MTEIEAGFEYIDHPADIQLHSWGANFERAIEQMVTALSGVMFDLKGFNDQETEIIQISANNLESLVYNFLSEFLFIFDTEDFVAKRCTITKCDLQNFSIEATAYGDKFDMEKHSSCRLTEVKAITYASMQIIQEKPKTEIYVIVDL